MDYKLKDFINGSVTLNDNSPRYIRENKKFVLASITKNINSIDYASNLILKQLSEEEKKKIITLAIKNNYIIRKKTPYFLRSNYDIIINSINSNKESINYCWFNNLNIEQLKEITNKIFKEKISYESIPLSLINKDEFILLAIKEDINIIDHIVRTSNLKETTKNEIKKAVLDSNYYLKSNSPFFLKKDTNVLIKSLKNNINSYKFAHTSAFSKESVEYLMDKGVLDDHLLSKMNINILKIDVILNHLVKNQKEKKYIKELLNNDIKIANINRFIEAGLNISWFAHIERYPEKYLNLWQRIIITTEECQTISDLNEELKYDYTLRYIYECVPEMQDTLKHAVLNYYQYNKQNQRQKAASERQKIVDICNLYLNKSKYNYIESKKNNIVRNCFIDDNQSFFKIKIKHDSITVLKYKEQLQRNLATILLDKKDENIIKDINEIIEKYSTNSDLISKIIYQTIRLSKLEPNDIIKKPDSFDSYLLSLDLNKLINRLNTKNISIQNKAFQKYQNYIELKDGKYKIVDNLLADINLEKCVKYQKFELLFKHVQRDTMNLIHNIEVDIDYDSLDLEFNDENYYCSEINMCVREFLTEYLDKEEINKIYESKNKDKLLDLLAKQNLFFLFLAMDKIYCTLFAPYSINDLIMNIDEVSNLINKLSLDNLNKILLYSNIFEDASMENIKLVKEKYIGSIIKKNDFDNGRKSSFKIKSAANYILKRHMKNISTIPYVKGSNEYYNYELYDELDDDILLSGINTNSCFRIDGYDNDFFYYAGLSVNGFVMKFTDKDGNFIGRASGFRNGNGIYINQLRSIFDKSDESTELSHLIDAFDKCCKDIINTSTKIETSEKIEFILVNKSYTLENNDDYLGLTVDFSEVIYNQPMDIDSHELRIFHIENSRYLNEGLDFTTDYGDYDLLCMASSIGELYDKKQIKEYDATPIYKRTRNKIKVFDNVSDAIDILNQTKAIYCHLEKQPFTLINESDIDKIVLGDNWYIIIRNDKIESLALPFDSDAIKEMECSLEEIKNDSKCNSKIKTLKNTI